MVNKMREDHSEGMKAADGEEITTSTTSGNSGTSMVATKEETIIKVATLATEEEAVVIALEMLTLNQVMIQVMIKVMVAVLIKTMVAKDVSEEVVVIIEETIVGIVEVGATMEVREWETITNKITRAPMARAMGINVPSELRAATEAEAGAKSDIKHGY